jgi:hypothetical protein
VDIDSLKVGGLGLSGYIVNCADVFSPVVEVGYMIVLIAYFVYRIKQIKSEIK